VLYTGIVSAAPGETWEWDGLAWTLATPAVSPPPRDLPGLVADDARQRVVLFGGFNGLLLADTWTWDGSNWTQHTTAPTPPARQDPGMAYDTQRQRVVMFGGIGGQETWEWNGTAWRLAATNGPSARLNPAMAYDPRRGRVVLHGGRLASTSRPGFDTWEWDGAEWTQTPVALGGLQEHSIAFDPRSGRMVAFGTDPVSRRDRWLELVHDDVGVPCHPLANGGATFTLDDAAPRLGHAFAATVTAPATSALAILLLGTQVPAPAFDLASIGLPGCRLHVGFVGFDQLLVLVVANGRATWSGLVPNSPSFTGMRFALQALVHSPQLGGLAATATNASVLVVRP
jgi:hypothetical protein